MNQDMSAPRKRVVVTGFGLVSPIGCDPETAWANLTEGKSGIERFDLLPRGVLKISSGGEVKDFTGVIDDYGPLDKKLQRAIKKNMKVMCREIEMGVAASQKALAHSGLSDERDAERCGCLFGCDYILTRPEEYGDGMRNCLSNSEGPFKVGDWPIHGLNQVNPLWLLKYLPNMPNSHVSIYNDFRGPNNSITMREASMNLAMAEAASIIERGAADVMLVGATGTRVHPLRTTHVSMMDRLAAERDNPAEMARPFDESCDGMVLGEGAGSILLESREHAEARGAKIWGEIIGQGAAMFGPRDQRDFIQMGVKSSIEATLKSVKELPEKWHLHAQGLSSPDFDQSESLAIGQVLSSYGDIPVTTAKSYFGNLGAGAGAIELICSLLALEHGSLFPILNLNSPSSHVTWRPAELGDHPGQAVLHTSFTAQGQVSSLMVAAA